jgi:hypothetical protein
MRARQPGPSEERQTLSALGRHRRVGYNGAYASFETGSRSQQGIPTTWWDFFSLYDMVVTRFRLGTPMTVKAMIGRVTLAGRTEEGDRMMGSPRTDVIESTAGQIAAEIARLGIDPARPVILTVEPDDWLTRARLECRKRVDTAGLTDEDIDRLIKEARAEANEDMRRDASPQPK